MIMPATPASSATIAPSRHSSDSGIVASATTTPSATIATIDAA
jgi:hypothetical protein